MTTPNKSDRATMPQATKELANKLLEMRKPGQSLRIPIAELRIMCGAVTDIEVVKHLRRMHAAGLIGYELYLSLGDKPGQAIIWAKRGGDES